MSRIIIEDENSLENMEIRLDHLLFSEKEIESEKRDYLPIEGLLDGKFADFPPYLISTGQLAKAATLIQGQDEVELFFLMILSGDEKSLFLRTLEKNREAVGEVFYQEMLCLAFLSAGPEERKQVMASLLQVPAIIRTPLAALLAALYSDEPQNIAPGGPLEQQAALFTEALKAERSDHIEKAFGDLLGLFIQNGAPRFLFEYLRALLLRHDGIPAPLVERFVEAVLKSSLAVSFPATKLLEFLYYWRNDVADKLEETVTGLAESTDSLFVLNAIAPLLYKHGKWHLLGKFYKLVSRKTTGKTRIRYLELLADIYEHKLKMPDFATEIHKNIVEEDPASCSISLSLVLSVYEENHQWEDLANLYIYLADREKEPKLAAYYLFRGGELMFRELNKPQEARPHLEHSLKLNRSFEIIRLLSELYLKLQDFDAYIANMEQELEYAASIPEKIGLHERIAEALITFKRAYRAAETHLYAILELKPDRLDTVKKLGKIYYITRNWQKLTEINSREVAITENPTDIVNLLYKNGIVFFNELRDMEKARQSFLQILAMVDHHIPSLLYLERIYLRENAVEDIIDLYNNLLQSATTDSETKEFYLTRLAILYREQGRLQEAQDTFRLILYLYPDSTIAKENLRLLSEEVEFREFNLDEFDHGELTALIAIANDPDRDAKTIARMESVEPDLYKYLWEMRTFGASEVPDAKMAPAERSLREILEGRPTIDLLAKHSTRPAALTLLAQRYLEKGYFKGIYTILNYYLKLNPELKRAFWSIFFMGRDHPELKDRLESLLVTEKDFLHFEIALNILEKIYLREKNYKTILFLRTLFIKKLKEPTLQRRFIDDTLTLLTGLVEPVELLDLYKLRYRLSAGAERNTFLLVYRDFLVSLGMRESLIKLYEEKWEAERLAADGGYLFDLYLAQHDPDKAAALAHEVLEQHPGASDVLDRLIDFYESVRKPQAANEALQRYLRDQTRPELGRAAAGRLMRAHLNNGNVAEAVSLFLGTSYENNVDRFAAGMDFADTLSEMGQAAFAAQIVRTLSAATPEEAHRKITMLFACSDVPVSDDLYRIPRYETLRHLAESRQNPAASLEILRHYARLRDPEAVESFLRRLIVDDRKDEAHRLIMDIGGDPLFQNGIVQSLVLKFEERYADERELLRQLLIPELRKGNPYPLTRLTELAGPGNKRARLFTQNLLASFHIESWRPAENEWQQLSVLREDILLAQAGFTPGDEKLRAFGRLLALGTVPEKKEERRLDPLGSSSGRELLFLVEKLSLALHQDAIPVFFDPNTPTILAIELVNLPVLVLGRGAQSADRKELAFLLASNFFLMQSGVTGKLNREGIELLIERLARTLALSGKERTAFLRGLKKKHQDEAAAAIGEIGAVGDPVLRQFGERLHLASILYAFSVIPDIAQVLSLSHETAEHLELPDSTAHNALDLALATFFG